MKVNYYPSESTAMPEPVDTTSSKTTVYLRRNIAENTRKALDGEITTYYGYEEARLTKAEYRQYLGELRAMDIRQQRADIDYIALMTGVDLGEC